MFKSSNHAFYGTEFSSDKIYDDYMTFEKSLYNFVTGYPRFLNRQGFQARDNVLQHLSEYLSDHSKTSLGSQIILSHLKVSLSKKPNELRLTADRPLAQRVT